MKVFSLLIASMTTTATALSQALASDVVEGGPLSSSSSSAQQLPEAPVPNDPPLTVVGSVKRVALDELHIAQFPRYIRKSDLKWALPLTGASIAALATDEKASTQVVSTNPSFNLANKNASDGLLYTMLAAPVVMFGVGEFTHDERARETGLLGSEAIVDAYAFGFLVKVASFRERPNVDRGEGSFFRTAAGTNSSFISGHALTAWSSAAVIAAEYPNKWTQIGVYTLASGVSLTRVLAQQHFPSDALIGSAAGWLIGHYVYKAHHRHIERR